MTEKISITVTEEIEKEFDDMHYQRQALRNMMDDLQVQQTNLLKSKAELWRKLYQLYPELENKDLTYNFITKKVAEV